MRKLQSTIRFNEALRPIASRIKAAIFDVDGVLTDGSLYISAEGETLKAFHALDGHGLKLLAKGGITPMVITGRDSPAVRRRLKDLGVSHAVFGAHDKLAAAGPLLASLGLQWDEVAVMGDDWPDLPLIVRAGLVIAPANAHSEVKAVADYTSGLVGGYGFARECCDLMLWATGAYDALLHGHLETLDTNVHEGPKAGRT